jgi:transcriptional regulator with XRE-family HTH domain
MAMRSSKRPKKRTRLMQAHDRARLYAAFGSRVRTLRIAKGITPTMAYHRFGIDMSNLGKYESGEREPGLAIIILFAKMLDVNHRDLMNFDFDFEVKP